MTLDPQAQMVLNLMPDDTLAVDRLACSTARLIAGFALEPFSPRISAANCRYSSTNISV